MARNEPSHQNLQSLPFGSRFLSDIPNCNQRRKSSLQKHRDEGFSDQLVVIVFLFIQVKTINTYQTPISLDQLGHINHECIPCCIGWLQSQLTKTANSLVSMRQLVMFAEKVFFLGPQSWKNLRLKNRKVVQYDIVHCIYCLQIQIKEPKNEGFGSFIVYKHKSKVTTPIVHSI